MDFDANVSFLRTAFWEILMISGPILGVALAIGLIIGIFQAATSIKKSIINNLTELSKYTMEDLLDRRYQRLMSYGK